MPVSEICTRNVVCARRDTSVKAAAQLMREYHVDSVVVVEEMGEKRIPKGIITDRDIAVAVVALALDPEVIQIGDVTAGALVSVRENWAIAEVVELMQIRSLRRMVVADADGYLFGIVSADDVLAHLAGEMRNLASMADGERHREAALRKVLV